MSELAIIDSVAFQAIDDVATLRIQGMSELAVAKQLKIPMKVVKERYAAWMDMLSNDASARDEARDRLHAMVQHYDILVKRAHDNLTDLAGLGYDEKVSAQVNATLKNIADFEAKRVDALQKAGLLESSDIGDEVAEMERKQEILIDILRNDLCAACSKEVKYRLTQVTGVVEGTVVE